MPQVTPHDASKPMTVGRSDTSMSTAKPLAAAPADATTEAAAVTETPAPSPELVELAKRTKTQRLAQLKLQNEIQAVEKTKLELAAKQKEYETNYVPRDRIKSDFLNVLAEAGITPEQVQTYFSQNGVSHDLEIRNLKRELAEIKAGRESANKQAEERQTQDYQHALNQIRSDAKALVQSDPNFDTIKELRAEEEVVKLIERVFQEGVQDESGEFKFAKGTVLTVEQAAQHVEDYLVEESLRRASLGKVKAKLAPPAAEAVTGATKQTTLSGTKQATPIKTITNSMVATPTKPLSPSERRARAIAIAEGRLVP